MKSQPSFLPNRGSENHSHSGSQWSPESQGYRNPEITGVAVARGSTTLPPDTSALASATWRLMKHRTRRGGQHQLQSTVRIGKRECADKGQARSMLEPDTSTGEIGLSPDRRRPRGVIRRHAAGLPRPAPPSARARYRNPRWGRRRQTRTPHRSASCRTARRKPAW